MMNKTSVPDFIVIDDDPTNNLICEMVIALAIPHAIIYTFTKPEAGLEHILSAYATPDANNAILFLDINMPVLSGWDVIDMMKNFPDMVKEHIKIFMLSSSIDPHDKENADGNLLISGFISKSLSEDKLQKAFPDM